MTQWAAGCRPTRDATGAIDINRCATHDGAFWPGGTDLPCLTGRRLVDSQPTDWTGTADHDAMVRRGLDLDPPFIRQWGEDMRHERDLELASPDHGGDWVLLIEDPDEARASVI